MRFSRQVYGSGLPFPPLVDHVLSELSAMSLLLSWVGLHGMAHSFIELCKPFCNDKAVVHEGNAKDIIKKILKISEQTEKYIYLNVNK